MTDKLQVYTDIAAVMAELSQKGISKDRKNQQQGYKFRGIDDVYNALSELLSKHKLCILPFCLGRESVERHTKTGSALFYTTVSMKYTIVSAVDGSSVECCTVGEAMDSADKSTNKAMSAAYKYLCLQMFCIPTEGDNDADATTPEPVVSQRAAPKPQQMTPPPAAKPQPTLQERIAKFKEYIAKASLYDLNDIKYKNKMDALCKEAGPEIAEELTNICNKRMVELVNA